MSVFGFMVPGSYGKREVPHVDHQAHSLACAVCSQTYSGNNAWHASQTLRQHQVMSHGCLLVACTCSICNEPIDAPLRCSPPNFKQWESDLESKIRQHYEAEHGNRCQCGYNLLYRRTTDFSSAMAEHLNSFQIKDQQHRAWYPVKFHFDTQWKTLQPSTSCHHCNGFNSSSTELILHYLQAHPSVSLFSCWCGKHDLLSNQHFANHVCGIDGCQREHSSWTKYLRHCESTHRAVISAHGYPVIISALGFPNIVQPEQPPGFPNIVQPEQPPAEHGDMSGDELGSVIFNRPVTVNNQFERRSPPLMEFGFAEYASDHEDEKNDDTDDGKSTMDAMMNDGEFDKVPPFLPTGIDNESKQTLAEDVVEATNFNAIDATKSAIAQCDARFQFFSGLCKDLQTSPEEMIAFVLDQTDADATEALELHFSIDESEVIQLMQSFRIQFMWLAHMKNGEDASKRQRTSQPSDDMTDVVQTTVASNPGLLLPGSALPPTVAASCPSVSPSPSVSSLPTAAPTPGSASSSIVTPLGRTPAKAQPARPVEDGDQDAIMSLLRLAQQSSQDDPTHERALITERTLDSIAQTKLTVPEEEALNKHLEWICKLLGFKTDHIPKHQDGRRHRWRVVMLLLCHQYATTKDGEQVEVNYPKVVKDIWSSMATMNRGMHDAAEGFIQRHQVNAVRNMIEQISKHRANVSTRIIMEAHLTMRQYDIIRQLDCFQAALNLPSLFSPISAAISAYGRVPTWMKTEPFRIQLIEAVDALKPKKATENRLSWSNLAVTLRNAKDLNDVHRKRLQSSDAGFLLSLLYVQCFELYSSRAALNQALLASLEVKSFDDELLPSTLERLRSDLFWTNIAANPDIEPLLAIKYNNGSMHRCRCGDTWLLKRLALLVLPVAISTRIKRAPLFGINVNGKRLPWAGLPSMADARSGLLQATMTSFSAVTVGKDNLLVPVAETLKNQERYLSGDTVLVQSTKKATKAAPPDGSIFCNCQTGCDGNRCPCGRSNLTCTDKCHSIRGSTSCVRLTAATYDALKKKHPRPGELAKQLAVAPIGTLVKNTFLGRSSDLVVALMRMFMIHMANGENLSDAAALSLHSPINSPTHVIDVLFSLFVDATPVFGHTHAFMLNFLVPRGGGPWRLSDEFLAKLDFPYVMGLFRGSDGKDTAGKLGRYWRDQLDTLLKNNATGVHVGGSLWVRFHWRFLKADASAARKFLCLSEGGKHKCPNCDLLFSTSQGLTAKDNVARYMAQVAYLLTQMYSYHHEGNPMKKQTERAPKVVTDPHTANATLPPVPQTAAAATLIHPTVYDRYPVLPSQSKGMKHQHPLLSLEHVNDLKVKGYGKAKQDPAWLVMLRSMIAQNHVSLDFITDALHNCKVLDVVYDAMVKEELIYPRAFVNGLIENEWINGLKAGDTVTLGNIPIQTMRAIFIAYTVTINPHRPGCGTYAAGRTAKTDMLSELLEHLANMLVLAYVRKPTAVDRLRFNTSVFAFHQRCSALFPSVCSSLYYHNWVCHMMIAYNSTEFEESALLLGRNDCQESMFARVQHFLKGHVRVPEEGYATALRFFDHRYVQNANGQLKFKSRSKDVIARSVRTLSTEVDSLMFRAGVDIEEPNAPSRVKFLEQLRAFGFPLRAFGFPLRNFDPTQESPRNFNPVHAERFIMIRYEPSISVAICDPNNSLLATMPPFKASPTTPQIQADKVKRLQKILAAERLSSATIQSQQSISTATMQSIPTIKQEPINTITKSPANQSTVGRLSLFFDVSSPNTSTRNQTTPSESSTSMIGKSTNNQVLVSQSSTANLPLNTTKSSTTVKQRKQTLARTASMRNSNNKVAAGPLVVDRTLILPDLLQVPVVAIPTISSYSLLSLNAGKDICSDIENSTHRDIENSTVTARCQSLPLPAPEPTQTPTPTSSAPTPTPTPTTTLNCTMGTLVLPDLLQGSVLAIPKISSEPMLSLEADTYISCDIINCTMELIVLRAKEKYPTRPLKGIPTAGSGYLNDWMTNANAHALERLQAMMQHEPWTVDMMVVFPIHVHEHWCLALIDVGNSSVEFYDSFSRWNGDRHFTVWSRYLRSVLTSSRMCGDDISPKKWTFTSVTKSANHQTHGSDCGAFVCYYMLTRLLLGHDSQQVVTDPNCTPRWMNQTFRPYLRELLKPFVIKDKTQVVSQIH